MTSKFTKIILGIMGLVVLSGIAAFLARQVINSRSKPAPQQKLEINKQPLPADKLPQGLPADLPLEKNAKVLQNFTSTTNDGRMQATRSYETSKSLAENLKIYTDYLTKTGWTVTATIDDEKHKFVAGRKDNVSIQIEMNTDPETQAKTVTISRTEFQ